jgi:transcriptional regulator with XRE-family HTH domain
MPQLSTEPRQLGAEVRKARRERGLKVTDLAARIGIKPGSLRNIENDAPASIEVLYRIASATQVPIERILRDPKSVAS